jgi:hypothetical protein
MSEYQYYEFQCVDRPLNAKEKQEISQISSRAKVTSTQAIFNYSYGDFSYKTEKFLAQYFDLMYYIANWGTQQLMFRFPKDLISLKAIAPYCSYRFIDHSSIGDWVILNWEFSQEEGFYDWIEGEGTLSELVALRQELLEGDYRGLYLAWLKSITLAKEEEDIDLSELEPPVPAGLKQLSPAQTAFVETFDIDENLLAVAATASHSLSPSSDESLQNAIASLSRSECDRWLLKLAKGQTNLSAKLNKKLSESIEKKAPIQSGKRTIQELFDLAEEEKERVEKAEKEAAQTQRIKDLQALAPREAQVWEEVDNLLLKAQSNTYDQAVKLLVQLQDLARYREDYLPFQQRLKAIRTKYSRRTGLLERLNKAGLFSYS